MNFVVRALPVIFLLAFTHTTYAQNNPVADTTTLTTEDSLEIINQLEKELSGFLDSVNPKKNYINISVAAGSGAYSYKSTNSFSALLQKKLTITPNIGYYHKSGFGIASFVYLLAENGKMNLFQYGISPSFDYSKRKKFSFGFAYTYYKTKDSLDFYTTPIQHEMYGYFSIKKWWLQPAVSIVYGFGSKTSYEKKQLQLLYQRLRRRGYVTIKTDEKINDFAIITSLKHNFNWIGIFGKQDYIIVTPVAMLSASTQKFGFNQSFSASVINSNLLPSNQQVNETTGIGLQAATLILRTEYGFGKFYLQPQLTADYYLQKADKPFNLLFAITAAITL
jgi:hypothetical protein